jgi:ring-1,2-phenylacetyl-CoA epoxidase subunit PaaD
VKAEAPQNAAALDYVRLAELGIGGGAHALAESSPITAPTVDTGHPRVRSAAADPASLEAAAIAGAVVDPEIPVLTLADLGVLRRVQVHDDKAVDVDISPTYSGCPAIAVMATDIRRALGDAGFTPTTVNTVLAPAWSTDDMTDTARNMLQRFGIAPPGPAAHAALPGARGPAPTAQAGPVALSLAVRCPLCGSRRTRQTSRFGSTACKAMYTCDDCHEPFDHFKPL